MEINNKRKWLSMGIALLLVVMFVFISGISEATLTISGVGVSFCIFFILIQWFRICRSHFVKISKPNPAGFIKLAIIPVVLTFLFLPLMIFTLPMLIETINCIGYILFREYLKPVKNFFSLIRQAVTNPFNIREWERFENGKARAVPIAFEIFGNALFVVLLFVIVMSAVSFRPYSEGYARKQSSYEVGDMVVAEIIRTDEKILATVSSFEVVDDNMVFEIEADGKTFAACASGLFDDGTFEATVKGAYKTGKKIDGAFVDSVAGWTEYMVERIRLVIEK